MLAFIPHLRPQVLDIFSMQNAVLGRLTVKLAAGMERVTSAFYPRAKQRHLFWPEPTSQYVLRLPACSETIIFHKHTNTQTGTERQWRTLL
jgi:hypothetical protein